ncbi:hypothetical protein ACUN9W_16365, partial [Escherichia coli]
GRDLQRLAVRLADYPGASVNILCGIAGCDAGRVLSGLHKSSPIRLRIGRYPGYFTSTTFSRNSSN